MRKQGPRQVTARASAAIGLAIALTLTTVAPVQAKPSYPSKDKVSGAQRKADNSASAAQATREKLATQRARMNRLDAKAETAVEAYNGALVKLHKAKRAYTSAKKQVKQSAKSVEKARKQVAGIAAAAYRGNGLAKYVALFGSSDPKQTINGVGAIGALSQQQDGVLAKLKAARIVNKVVRQQASKALENQQQKTKKVKAAKERAQAQVAAQQQVISRVAALESKLSKRASDAENTANSLAHERTAGIAKARRIAAEQARREAARRAAAARKAAKEKAEQQAAQQATHHSSGHGGGHHGSGHHGSSGGHHHSHHHASHGAAAAVQFAYAQLGKWYVWGADGPATYDCSGLTMRAWQQAGVYLPHWSVGQYYQTSRVSLSNLRKGDLVFYANNTSDPDTIHHVAIYIGGGRMIEAPHTGAQVRISSIYRPGLIGAGRP
ncbi:MAG: NlpC/P60 family protein [Streptosporangiales bacterium]